MANFKRHRMKTQRAGFTADYRKAQKAHRYGIARGGLSKYSSSGAWLRLRERAREAA